MQVVGMSLKAGFASLCMLVLSNVAQAVLLGTHPAHSVVPPLVPSWDCPVNATPPSSVAFHGKNPGAPVVALFGTQNVTSTNYWSLNNLSMGGKHFLIAFFAPWCPHCEVFVVSDVSGNRTNAPLEVLKRRIIQAGGPDVVKYDTTQGQPPSMFNVRFIPTIYLVTEKGAAVEFEGSADNLDVLQHFAMTATAPPTNVAPVHMHLRTEVEVPSWACLASPPNPGAVALHGRNLAIPTTLFGPQNVTDVNASSLMELASSGQRLLVAFFAPWCPHCQSFVISDAAGNRTNAPLEVLKRRIDQAGGPEVVKFSTTQGDPPSMFSFRFIPTMFVVTEDGAPVKFEGDTTNLDALQNFASTATAAPTNPIPVQMHLQGKVDTKQPEASAKAT